MNIPKTGDVYQDRAIAITIKEVDPEGKWVIVRCEVTAQDWRHKGKVYVWERKHPTPDGYLPDSWVRQ
jgi:hypothetical protein